MMKKKKNIMSKSIRLCLFFTIPILTIFMSAGNLFALGTVTIGGNIFEGSKDAAGNPLYAPASIVMAITDANVMVQNQHSGGAFITYGDVSGNAWTADVPCPGDYIVMISSPDHDATSREFTVDEACSVKYPLGIGNMQDAYLPPLPLPDANLLFYVFYDNYVNGEDDAPADQAFNGVTVKACPEDDYPNGPSCQTAVTGSQNSILATDGTQVCNNTITPGSCDGYYYFTGLPTGEVIVTSDPSTAYNYSQPINPVTGTPLTLDSSTEFYLMTSEEGGKKWDPKLYPGDPGTVAGGYMIWHGYVKKLGQLNAANISDPERFGVRGMNPALAGSIIGSMLDADGSDPTEACLPANPFVTCNTKIPDGFIVLFATSQTKPVRPVATTTPNPNTGYFRFDFVPPGNYKLFFSDTPIDYVWSQAQASVWPGLEAHAIGLIPRFFARAHGCVKDSVTNAPITDANISMRLKGGNIWKKTTTDDDGCYLFDDLPEVEVMGYVNIELPDGYRGEKTTIPGISDTYEYNLMSMSIKWFTMNYEANLSIEPIPDTQGDIGGFVYNDSLELGTWTGDGIYNKEEERTFTDVTVELYNADGTTLIATTTTGKFDKDASLAQGWIPPYTATYDMFGGSYYTPTLPGYYEFRELPPGDYRVKVIPPNGFSSSPRRRLSRPEVAQIKVIGGQRYDHNFGINTLVPLAGEIEGGVFDDVNIDWNAQSLLFQEKAGITGAPVGVYDHLGYLMGAGFMGNSLCYEGSTICPAGEPPVQKPEVERRFAPGIHLFFGNDPAFPEHNKCFSSFALAYKFGQGNYKFEADWAVFPSSFGECRDIISIPVNGPTITNVVQ